MSEALSRQESGCLRWTPRTREMALPGLTWLHFYCLKSVSEQIWSRVVASGTFLTQTATESKEPAAVESNQGLLCISHSASRGALPRDPVKAAPPVLAAAYREVGRTLKQYLLKIGLAVSASHPALRREAEAGWAGVQGHPQHTASSWPVWVIWAPAQIYQKKNPLRCTWALRTLR